MSNVMWGIATTIGYLGLTDNGPSEVVSEPEVLDVSDVGASDVVAVPSLQQAERENVATLRRNSEMLEFVTSRRPLFDEIGIGSEGEYPGRVADSKRALDYYARRYIVLNVMLNSLSIDYLGDLVADDRILAIWNMDPAAVLDGLDSFIREAGRKSGFAFEDGIPPSSERQTAILVTYDLLRTTYELNKQNRRLSSEGLRSLLERYRIDEKRYYPGVDLGSNLYLIFLINSRSKILPEENTLDAFKKIGCMNKHMENMRERILFQKRMQK